MGAFKRKVDGGTIVIGTETIIRNGGPAAIIPKPRHDEGFGEIIRPVKAYRDREFGGVPSVS